MGGCQRWIQVCGDAHLPDLCRTNQFRYDLRRNLSGFLRGAGVERIRDALPGKCLAWTKCSPRTDVDRSRTLLSLRGQEPDQPADPGTDCRGAIGDGSKWA